MSPDEHIQVAKSFKEFYRSCYEREKRENVMLWDALLAMINICATLDDVEADTALRGKVARARVTALQQAEFLRRYLDNRA